MLSSIRKFSTSIFAKILLGIVVIPFVFWGMGSSFRGGNKNVIVSIDKEKFSTSEFANFVNSQQVENEKITPTKIDQLLSAFIGDKLIEKEYDYFNVKLSDKSLSKLIKNQKEFKKENKFSRIEYEKFLVSNRLNPIIFEANLANQEKKKQLLNFIGGGIVPSKFIINDVYNSINQKRKIELINLNDSLKNEFNFSENDIKSFYEKNKDEYNEVYKSIKILEITPSKLIGSEDYNDIFFQKLDQIQDLIISGEKIEEIINLYNLVKFQTLKINKFGEDLNYNSIKNLPKNVVTNAFLISDDEPTAFVESEDKFFVIEVYKTENISRDLTNNNVVKNIKEKLKILKKRKLLSLIISKINQNNFKKIDFDNFSKEKNTPIQKITLNGVKDNKILKDQVINQIYSYPKKKIIVSNDLGLNENFLIYIDEIINISIDENSEDYEKYFKIAKISIANELFNTYDDYIKKKYEIDINYKALNTVKSYFN